MNRLLKTPIKRVNTGDLGPGDDCASLDGWLITTDISVEGTHFRLDWSGIEKAVRKCVLSNLSDINAMGGVAQWALLGICLKKEWGVEEQDRVIQAFRSVLDSNKVGILGGDTVVGEQASFQLTVLGRCPEGARPLLRRGARPRDNLYVTGHLGASKAGLWALQKGLQLRYPEAVALHLEPDPPLLLGPMLHVQEVSACIDLSDGLSSELHHLAIQSGVRLQIHESQIPIWPGLATFCQDNSLNEKDFWLHGGEEYQLLFSSVLPESLLVLALQPYSVQCIGQVLEGKGVALIDNNNQEIEIQPGAWSHL